jgi:Mg-chelatase subunit ChlD
MNFFTTKEAKVHKGKSCPLCTFASFVVKIKSLVFYLAFYSIACCYFVRFSAYADQRALKTSTSEAIDAVLVLDNSGSMLLTDPKRLRDDGAKLFLEFLKSGDRVGVVQFSKDAQIVQELGDFQPQKTEEISKAIDKLDSSGQYTDLFAGVKLAQEMLQKNPRKDVQQVIVLLSDGKMDPDPSVANATTRTNDLFNNILPDMKAAGVKIHTVSFSDQADKDTLSQIAASTEGMSLFTTDAENIHQSYANLFLAVKKPQVLPLTGKAFKIDADVQEATFYVNREDGTEIKIIAPGNKSFTSASFPSNVRWFHGQKFDVISMAAPEVGEYQIIGLSSQDGFATLLTNLKLITEWPSTVNSEEDTLLQARLYEAEKPVVLPSMTGHVNYAFQITPTDKISEPVVKAFLNDEGKDGDKIANDGIFSAFVNLKDSGDYTLKVVAHAPTFDRYQQLPFRVKPRMVSLSIAKHAVTSKHTKEHGDEHSEKSSAEASHDNDHAGTSEEGHDSGPSDEEDYFVVRLSPEARELKEVKVSVLAIDRARARKIVELEETEDPLVFEIATKVLKNAGFYEVQANLVALTKSKKPMKASSEKINYELKTAEESGPVVHIEGQPTETIAVKKKIPTSPVLYIILISVVNLVLAGAIFFLMKKSSTGAKVVLPEFAPLEPVKTKLASLKDRVSVTQIDLNDPIFSGKGSVAADLTSSSSGSQAVSVEESPVEAVAPDAPQEAVSSGEGADTSPENSTNTGEA